MPGMEWYQAYRDEYAGDNYPFSDAATLASQDGSIALLPGMFVDAAIYPAGGQAGARVAAIVVAPGSVTLVIGDDDSPATASTTFDPQSIPATLELVDPAGRPAGLLLADPTALAAAQAWPPGTCAFAPGAAEFVARCCFPSPYPGVLAVSAAGQAVAGDLWLVGGPGVVLSWVDGSIRIDVVGDPLSARRDCAGAGLFATPAFLATLEVSGTTGPAVALTPDANGDVRLIVGSGLAADTTLRLSPSGSDTLVVSVAGANPAG